MSKNLLEELTDFMALKKKCYYQFFEDTGLSELTLKQMMYLTLIADHEPLTVSEIAVHLNIAKPSVTQMVRRFESLGCTTRNSCPLDRRKYYVVLTDEGKKIAQSDILVIERLSKKIENSLDASEVELLINLLSKINEEEHHG